MRYGVGRWLCFFFFFYFLFYFFFNDTATTEIYTLSLHDALPILGEGPFPTEMSEEEAERLGIVEYGTVTGRRRRVGHFDFELARYAAMINSASQIALTCVDYFGEENKGVRSLDELTREAREFVETVEKKVKVPVTIISTGPDLEDTINLREEKV